MKCYIEKFVRQMKMLYGNPSLLDYTYHSVRGVCLFLIIGSTITDYFELSLYKRKVGFFELMTWRYHKRFIYSADKSEIINKLSSKENMYEALGLFCRRRIISTRRLVKDDLLDFTKENEVFFYKPIDESCGRGIERIKASEIEVDTLFQKLSNMKIGVLDPQIVQHEKMRMLNPNSVNTIRIFTLRTNEKIFFIGASLRIGLDLYVDNYSAGGLVGAIDLKSGKVIADAENYLGHRFKYHPKTNEKIEGFQVPNWNKVLDYVFNMAEKYELNYVAWDIAVTPSDCIVIEANPAGMINVIQIAGATPKRRVYEYLTRVVKASPYYFSQDKKLERVLL